MTVMSLDALVTYWAQVAIVGAGVAAATALLARRLPQLRLAAWRTFVAVAMVLPFAPALTASAPLAAVLRTTVSGTAAVVASITPGAVGPGPIWLLLALGCAARTSWLAIGMWHLRKAARSGAAHHLPPSIDAAARALAPRARFYTAPVDQPVSFGWRRPAILLPARFASLPEDVQRVAVLHECAHVARHDWPSLVTERMLEAVLWFHPAIWWAVDQIQLAREQLVDEFVVRATGDRGGYARALLAFADAQPLPGLASGLFRRRHLARRVDALANRRLTGRRAVIGATIGIALIASGASATALTLAAQRDDTIYSPGNGVSLPSVVKEVKPGYTPEALKAKIRGRVALSCVVRPDGTPDRITVTQSLDTQYGLDDEAIKALEQWRFTPGLRRGRPVAVRVTIEMTFTLK